MVFMLVLIIITCILLYITLTTLSNHKTLLNEFKELTREKKYNPPVSIKSQNVDKLNDSVLDKLTELLSNFVDASP